MRLEPFKMTNFEILSIYFCFWIPKYVVNKWVVRSVLRWNLLNKTQGLTFQSPKDSEWQNSDYKVH
jgi:hypothetical protein